MVATYAGNEIKYTRRYELGRVLSARTQKPAAAHGDASQRKASPSFNFSSNLSMRSVLVKTPQGVIAAWTCRTSCGGLSKRSS